MQGAIERRGTSWRIRVDAGRDPVSGRRRQVTRTVRGTEREAQEALTRLLVEMGEERHQGTGDVTLGALCSDWLAHARSNMEPNTAAEFEGSIRRYTGARTDVASRHDVLRAGIDSIPLRKLRAWDLDRFYGQLLEVEGGAAGLYPPAASGRFHRAPARAEPGRALAVAHRKPGRSRFSSLCAPERAEATRDR